VLPREDERPLAKRVRLCVDPSHARRIGSATASIEKLPSVE
jgi:hypothetical protein